MIRDYGPRITTLDQMRQAGLFRLSRWLQDRYPAIPDRMAELSRRFPAAPANEIAAAVTYCRDCCDLADRCERSEHDET